MPESKVFSPAVAPATSTAASLWMTKDTPVLPVPEVTAVQLTVRESDAHVSNVNVERDSGKVQTVTCNHVTVSFKTVFLIPWF